MSWIECAILICLLSSAAHAAAARPSPLPAVAAATAWRDTRLESLIDQAMGRNPSLHARRSEVSAARHEVRAARWQYAPSLSAQYQQGSGPNKDLCGSALRADQRLYTGERLDLDLDGAVSRRDSALLAVRESGLALAMQVTSAYQSLQAAQGQRAALWPAVLLRVEQPVGHLPQGTSRDARVSVLLSYTPDAGLSSRSHANAGEKRVVSPQAQALRQEIGQQIRTECADLSGLAERVAGLARARFHAESAGLVHAALPGRQTGLARRAERRARRLRQRTGRDDRPRRLPGLVQRRTAAARPARWAGRARADPLFPSATSPASAPTPVPALSMSLSLSAFPSSAMATEGSAAVASSAPSPTDRKLP
jgi:hypothetical protein